jgi:hypothetical protein
MQVDTLQIIEEKICYPTARVLFVWIGYPSFGWICTKSMNEDDPNVAR